MHAVLDLVFKYVSASCQKVLGFLTGLCAGSGCRFVGTSFAPLHMQVRVVIAVERTKKHRASSPLKSLANFNKHKISRHKKKPLPHTSSTLQPPGRLPRNANLWSSFQCPLTSSTFVHVSASLRALHWELLWSIKIFPSDCCLALRCLPSA